MRIPDAILVSVVGLLLVPVLLPLGAALLISVAVVFVPVIPVLAVVALTTLIVLAARRRQRGTASVLPAAPLNPAPYSFDGPILAVSRDGRRALSAQSVYDVATGTRLGALPVVATTVAISPDGAKALLSSGGALRAVDLTAF
jgi:hypothetical protein